MAGDIATRKNERKIFINTAKLKGCIDSSGFRKGGGVEKNKLIKNITENVNKTNRF